LVREKKKKNTRVTLQDIPVVPTVSAVVTILNFRHQENEPTLFDIPKDYNKTNIKLNFDFEEQTKGKEDVEEKGKAILE